MRERGDEIEGVGRLIDCPHCAGAGWIKHPYVAGTRGTCPRCAGKRLLLDDSDSTISDPKEQP